MFEIRFAGNVVGKAELKKEGMYYRIRCSCKLPKEGIHRVQLSDGKCQKDLGICVPSGEEFALIARVVIKDVDWDNAAFTLEAGVPVSASTPHSVSVPISEGVPFPYLDKLDTARLSVNSERPEVVIDPAQDLPDSGQSQEPVHISELQ